MLLIIIPPTAPAIIASRGFFFIKENGMIIMEIGEDQKDLIVSMFNDFNLVESLVDYSGNDRVLIFKK